MGILTVDVLVYCLFRIQLLSQVLDKAAKGEEATIDPLNSKQVDVGHYNSPSS